MTLWRMMIQASYAAGLVKADNFAEAMAWTAVTLLAWVCTTDPLPAAVDRGLEAFKKKYQR